MAGKRQKSRERNYQNQRIINFRPGSGWEERWKRFADEAVLRSPGASQGDRVWIADLFLEAMDTLIEEWDREK